MAANPRWSLKYTALKFTNITYLVDKYCVGNKYFDALPSFITYPIVKYALYFEHQVQKLFAHNRTNNIFVYTKKVKRLAHDSDAETIRSSRKRSLRGHVVKKRKPLQEIFGLEKVRHILRTGL